MSHRKAELLHRLELVRRKHTARELRMQWRADLYGTVKPQCMAERVQAYAREVDPILKELRGMGVRVA